ncbi:MAG: hypothetical protein SXG53_18830 [Pseudomonadota bacterium]|nr:hypothetical protein [Pseudomonadota bacterium]
MSRHFFKCELRCEVLVRVGYNPTLDEFFLEVERVGANPEQGYSPFLYNSIDDPFNTGDDLDYYREKLEKLGLVVPETMFQSVEQDAERGVERRYAQHFADGRIIEPVPN